MKDTFGKRLKDSGVHRSSRSDKFDVFFTIKDKDGFSKPVGPRNFRTKPVESIIIPRSCVLPYGDNPSRQEKMSARIAVYKLYQFNKSEKLAKAIFDELKLNGISGTPTDIFGDKMLAAIFVKNGKLLCTIVHDKKMLIVYISVDGFETFEAYMDASRIYFKNIHDIIHKLVQTRHRLNVKMVLDNKPHNTCITDRIRRIIRIMVEDVSIPELTMHTTSEEILMKDLPQCICEAIESADSPNILVRNGIFSISDADEFDHLMKESILDGFFISESYEGTQLLAPVGLEIIKIPPPKRCVTVLTHTVSLHGFNITYYGGTQLDDIRKMPDTDENLTYDIESAWSGALFEVLEEFCGDNPQIMMHTPEDKIEGTLNTILILSVSGNDISGGILGAFIELFDSQYAIFEKTPQNNNFHELFNESLHRIITPDTDYSLDFVQNSNFQDSEQLNNIITLLTEVSAQLTGIPISEL